MEVEHPGGQVRPVPEIVAVAKLLRDLVVLAGAGGMQEAGHRIGQHHAGPAAQIRHAAAAVEILLGVRVLPHEGADRGEPPHGRVVSQGDAVDLRGQQVAVRIVVGHLVSPQRLGGAGHQGEP